MKVKVIIRGQVELPDDEEERQSMYGSRDPIKCVQSDWENDDGTFMLDFLEDPVLEVDKTSLGEA